MRLLTNYGFKLVNYKAFNLDDTRHYEVLYKHDKTGAAFLFTGLHDKVRRLGLDSIGREYVIECFKDQLHFDSQSIK